MASTFAVAAFGWGVALAAAGAGENPASERPDITGRWKLNTEKSDDAQAKMREVMDGGPHDGRRGGGRGGRMGGGMGRGRMGGSEAGAPMRQAMDDILQPAEVLTITQSDPDVVIAGSDGRSVRLHADGRRIKAETGNVERKAEWDGSRLVVESTIGDRSHVIQSWTKAADGKQLSTTIRLKMPMARKEVVINRVYDFAPPE
jgi:hypothetical protein